MILGRIQRLEITGATIHVLQLDISSQNASGKLKGALKYLSPLPVLGVIHAAAVSGFGYIKNTNAESYASVMAPKIVGALALHEAFPPRTLDFFILFSSISGIVGTLGHSAYAASNAFLDGLAEYRRSQGCNSTAIAWTVWRGLGLASNATVVDTELQAAGMRDITATEAFKAWERLSGSNTCYAVVTRLQSFDTEELVPIDLIREVAPRRCTATKQSNRLAHGIDQLTGSKLKAHIAARIRECLVTVLDVHPEDIGDETKLVEIGVDSFVNIRLHQMLRKELPNSVAVPRSLLWDCSTIEDLINEFCKKIEGISSS